VECDAPGLTWKTANKTNYTSYPDPGSEECVKYNGCTWAGQFAACDDKKPESWVSAHNIVAAFPDFKTLSLHDLCLRKGNKTIQVTVLDTCGDSDCSGCCTQNKMRTSLSTSRAIRTSAGEWPTAKSNGRISDPRPVAAATDTRVGEAPAHARAQTPSS
jgi:hypothetical protein